jgi:AraC-like DNA-binding protein
MDEIAASVYRSNDYVKKQFKQYYGTTPYAYYLDLKITHAKYLLQKTNLPIKLIADRLGYKSDRYFSKRFREMTGITATAFRKNKQTDDL